MDKLQILELKRKLEELKAIRGRATELISLYIPPTRNIADVTDYLKNEYAQSSNIKSRTTRKNVMWAIDSLLGKLKFFKTPPPNGMVFLIGTKAVSVDKSEPVFYFIEPPLPLNTYFYRCDSFFYLHPLEEMIAEKEIFGLLVMDRKEATIGILRGKRIEAIKNLYSLVPSKHSKGGQSQKRFERLIEIAAHEFYVKVAEIANSIFLNEKELKGILIGGPGATKTYFANQNYLHHELQKKIIQPFFDTGYTDEYGLGELVEKAKDTIADLSVMREKKLVQRFLLEIKKGTEIGIYGISEVRRALELGAVEILLLSENLKKYFLKLVCKNNCEYEKEEYVEDLIKKLERPDYCPKCGGALSVEAQKDIVEEFYEIADAKKTAVEFISKDTPEGEQFLHAFGGVGALLRYRL